VGIMLHGLPRPLLLHPTPPAYRLIDDGRRRILDIDPSRPGDQPVFREGFAVADAAAAPMERSEDDLVIEDAIFIVRCRFPVNGAHPQFL
jgi:hypothetical protein